MGEQSYEIHKVYIPLERQWQDMKGGILGSLKASFIIPTEFEGTHSRWEVAEQYAANGWELVATVPVISGFFYDGIDEAGGFSFLNGYTLLFKRRVK